MTAEINKIECKQNRISRLDQCNLTWSLEKTNITDKFLATLIKKIGEKILKNNFGNERSPRTLDKSDNKNAFKKARNKFTSTNVSISMK